MKISKRKVYFIGTALICSIVLLFSPIENILLPVLCVGIVAFASCWLVHFDFYHPACWFPPFFFLYSCSYAILYAAGINTKYGYSKDPLVLCFIGFLSVIFVLPEKSQSIRNHEVVTFADKKTLRILRSIGYILAVIIILSLVFLWGSGFSRKSEIYANGGVLINLVFQLVYFQIAFFTYSLYFQLASDMKINYFWLTVIEISVIMFSVATGERNYMFQILLITIICYSLVGKIKWHHMLAIVSLALFVLPLSRSFKYFFLTREASSLFSANNIIYEFLDGEFISAGRNLQLLTSNELSNYFKGRSLLNDFIRIFISTGYSNQTWFHNMFFEGHRTGYGFTLVGEGYVNGGFFGVVIVMVFVGLLIRSLYSYASKSKYGMFMYIFMIPYFIYSVRADIANILSALVKYAFLSLIVIKLINSTEIRRENNW